LQKRTGYLLLTVLVSGMTSMGVEMAASRLLDPYFGNSILIWANLIGLVLIYLTAGYYIGGRWADRDPRPSTLYQITAWAAFFVGVIPFVSSPILRWSMAGFANYSVGILAGSFLGVLILFCLPVTLLGCVSPFSIRLALTDIRQGGNIAGKIYAISTLGSILGTFLPVLLLIPQIGTRRTFLCLSAVLLLVSLGGLAQESRRRSALTSLLLLPLIAMVLFGGAAPIKASPEAIYETESTYNYIQVQKYGEDIYLRLNEGQGIHSIYNPSSVLTGGIWDYFLIAPFFNPAPFSAGKVQSLMLIGSAAGTVPKQYTAAYGPIFIDGVELDPQIIRVGREFFDMNEPNLNAIAQDGRYYAANSNRTYDVIAIDAYRPPYIPFHLTTREFFEQLRAHLTPNGVVAVNTGRTRTDYSLANALASTLKSVFPSVFVLDAYDGGSELGNSLVVATMQPAKPADFVANIATLEQPLLKEVGSRSLDTKFWEVRCDETAAWQPANSITTGSPVTACLEPFTDDRAPVEQVIHSLIFRYVLGGL
jgi:spermidine synthase